MYYFIVASALEVVLETPLKLYVVKAPFFGLRLGFLAF